jgi:hypothetical protein
MASKYKRLVYLIKIVNRYIIVYNYKKKNTAKKKKRKQSYDKQYESNRLIHTIDSNCKISQIDLKVLI